MFKNWWVYFPLSFGWSIFQEVPVAFPGGVFGEVVSLFPGDGSFARKAHAAGAWTVLAALLERNLEDYYIVAFRWENWGKNGDDVGFKQSLVG